ncbi:hypothetical protein LCGC14_0915010 [marine sediment metagenome]|uniref:Uncharacterized protein n=1 Tax=marine sediment metagenome TaxID=412755 RepID=A0A0F9RBA5_9ZZZZ
MASTVQDKIAREARQRKKDRMRRRYQNNNRLSAIIEFERSSFYADYYKPWLEDQKKQSVDCSWNPNCGIQTVDMIALKASFNGGSKYQLDNFEKTLKKWRLEGEQAREELAKLEKRRKRKRRK